MRIVDPILRTVLNRLGKERGARWIGQWAEIAGIDLLGLAHRRMGIMKYQSMEETGEEYLVRGVLPRLLAKPAPVLLDVGANVGEFSRLLRSQFPSARILAFEPVSATFDRLRKNMEGLDVRCLNFGLGATEETVPIYLSSRAELNPLASLYPAVAKSIHRFPETVAETIRIRTLDAVAAEENTDFIDLLKVDAEGHEFAVLQGGLGLIRSNRVGAVLFEFNEMNAVSKVFLRDFYETLAGYRFYRLDSRRLIPLGGYQPRNEIFQFQNILAVHSALHPTEEWT